MTAVSRWHCGNPPPGLLEGRAFPKANAGECSEAIYGNEGSRFVLIQTNITQTFGPLFNAAKKQASSHEKTWRSLNCTLLSKRSQSEKTPNGVIPTMRHSGKGKQVATGTRVVVRESGRKRWKSGLQGQGNWTG